MKEYHYRCDDAKLLPHAPTYTYVAAHPGLRPYIAHYTVRYPLEWPASTVARLSLVPDAGGCLVLFFDGTRLTQFLWGATTVLAEVANTDYRDLVHVFVEFRPGGLAQLFGGEVPDLTNYRFPLREVDPQLCKTLEDLFYSAVTMEDFLSALNDCFLSRMLERKASPVVRGAMDRMQAQFLCGILVKEIAQEFGCSERHLSRLFHETVGMPAKGYLKVLRVNRAITLMRGTGKKLSEIAHDTGFYDQSHFNRDFKELCSVSPSEYRSKAERFYNEPLKLSPLV